MIVAVVAAFCLAACTESVDNAEKVDRLPQIYPDYIGVTIPAGIDNANTDSFKEVKVVAQAIQADGFDTWEAAFAAYDAN